MPTTTPALPPLTPVHLALEHTRFSQWFPRYRRHTIKATILDLKTIQPDFVEWLDEDTLVLPKNSESTLLRQGSPVHAPDDPESDTSDDEGDGVQPRDFGALNAKIRQVIEDYEAVFPKLEWSAPQDAAWILPGSTLRCSTPADVYLLLKSSDFVSKDVAQLQELNSMAEHSTFPSLVLKKFFTIPTSHEFRCFVRNGRLQAISQRDAGTFFEHLQSPSQQDIIRTKLQHFHYNVLWPNEESQRFPIADFVWDAYLTRDQSRVLIVDINPYLSRTDSLLWSWSEIDEEVERTTENGSDLNPLPMLRLVTSRAQTTQSFPTYAHNMVPSDVMDIAQGCDIAQFAQDFNSSLAEAALDNSSSDESNGIVYESSPGR